MLKNRTKWSKYDEKAKELYTTTNLSMPEVAKVLGMPYYTLTKRLRSMGVKGDRVKSLKGKPKSEAHKAKLRIPHPWSKGDKSWRWKGGCDKWGSLRRNCFEYQRWMREVYKRDNYICKGCGYSKGGILEAHHILPRESFPEKIFEVLNGITLCENCHRKVHSVNKIKRDELLENLKPLRTMVISSRARHIIIIEMDEKVQRLIGENDNSIIRTRASLTNSMVSNDIV